MISSKRGKLYFKLIVAAAIVIAAAFAYSAIAAVPLTTPLIANAASEEVEV